MDTRARERGATLLDAVVGIGLMLVVFTGIVGAFRLTVQVVGNNSARAGAIALANERLEYIRSLAYDDVGTMGGIPAGDLAQEESVELNATQYTRRTFVSYEDDPADGLDEEDDNEIVTDYKAVKTSVSWQSRQGVRTITMVARISPPGVEQDVPGGTLAIQVVNDADQPVFNASVVVRNTSLDPWIDTTTFTNDEGLATVLGAPPGANYEITVTRPGYTTAQTYGPNATNTNPTPAHLSVALYQTTAASFEIDLLSNLAISTFEPIEEVSWEDELNNVSQIGAIDGTTVTGGELVLTSGEEGYTSPGSARSNALAPEYLYGWKEVFWEPSTPPGTGALVHVYTGSGTLVPDGDLPGNSAGFVTSPVSLTGLSTTTYPGLAIGAVLSTSNPSSTPAIGSWGLLYDVGPIPIPDVEFNLRGAKTIGSGPGGPVYKLDQSFVTDNSGIVDVLGLEYDVYTIAPSGYDVSSICPSQPVTVPPGASAAAQLFLVPQTAHSLLVDVRASGGGNVPEATVRLQRAGYDETLTTNACGQVHFAGIAQSDTTPYALEVTAAGYQTFADSEVEVTGTTQFPVLLNN